MKCVFLPCTKHNVLTITQQYTQFKEAHSQLGYWGNVHSVNTTDNASHRSGYSEAIGPHYTEGTPHTNNHTLVHSDHSTFTMDRWQSLILLYIIQRTLARSHTSVGLCSASGSSWRRPAPSRAQVSSPPPWERNRSRAEWSPSSNADGMML